MIKKLLNVSGTQVLGKSEQSKVLGGILPPKECNEENRCKMAGWCCTDNICIKSGPNENGIYPRCDYM